jgi:heat shock protein HtpX
MRRVRARITLALIGIGVFVTYAAAAVGAYLLVAAVWSDPNTRITTALLLVGTTIFFGLLGYLFGTRQLLTGLDARPFPRQQSPDLHDRIDRLAGEMAVERPNLYVAQLGSPNAFAVGGVRSGAVVVDPSLFRLLDLSELEAIIAHELAHLETYDGLIQTLAYSCLRTFVGVLFLILSPVILLSIGFFRAFILFRGRPDGWPAVGLSTLYRVLASGVSAVLIALTLLVRAHSRRREFAADDRAVAVTGNPRALASALYRIHRATDDRWNLLSQLYIDGHEDNSLSRLLSTHPPMEQRIERLLGRSIEERHAHQV